MAFRLILLLVLFTALAASAPAQSRERRTTIATVLLNNSELERNVSDLYEKSFLAADLDVLDRDLTRAAARGAGYAPSLNMAVSEARTFGSAIGSDFFVLIDAQTLRRSPSSNQIYFDSYASIFLVSSRTGRLWRFQWIKLHGPTPGQAERHLLKGMSDSKQPEPLIEVVRQAEEEERNRRALAVGREIPVIEVAPDDSETATAEGIQLPRPFRRLQPPYTETAASAEVEAVVDVIVDLDKNGEVVYREIARWAGFDLDEATLDTVKKLHFFPAMRNGAAIPLRVLLRYNFRKPPK
ncbi:MAG: energy transducer TonB [Acidobacteriota bacterium]|nr:energy transducer TonB [Acidobacteriota bacterium]